ncbi:hypothetical protein N185_28895 [Sinorhizobium sp. GW3]|nr:hypothetical protein N185_28895 [Sinorhizobium sp. GW3]
MIAAVVLVIASAYRALFAFSDTFGARHKQHDNHHFFVFVLENSQDRDSIAMQA